jgi:GT2 family glycosyltransferase
VRTPRCSIVVPVHNHVALTKRCLESILECTPDTAHELIVVDDGSADRTDVALGTLGESARFVRLRANSGFATACNTGASTAASTEFLLFLNNDTVARPGWLDTMVEYATTRHVDVVGAKLLFPNDTIQHAGVAICQDGFPRNLYSGFRADHPAASHSRALRAVTGACMLVRRPVFEATGGFDAAFRNCLEDVDFCLRAHGQGATIHYCADAVLYHLESTSRGRRSHDADAAARLFRDRWLGRVPPDDFEIYLEDGLIDVAYDGLYPARLTVSSELATLDPGRGPSVERQLASRSRQAADLLYETVRLTARLAEAPLEPSSGLESSVSGSSKELTTICARIDEIEAEIYEVQRELDRLGTGPSGGDNLASDYLGYRGLVRDVRKAVDRVVPRDATIAVISRGDDMLLDVETRSAWHFPARPDGRYLGYYPASGEEALEWLLDIQARGVEYLVVPDTSKWWLTRYAHLGSYLARCEEIADAEPACWIYRLRGDGGYTRLGSEQLVHER